MADTELFDEDVDVDMDEEDEDLELDFDHLFPEPNAYEVKILSVAWRSYDNEKTGRHVIGLNVRLQMQEDAGEFNGQQITHFVYLGEDKVDPQGRIRLKALFDAAGLEVGGKVKVSEWGPEYRQLGKVRDKVLTIFDDIMVGVNLGVEEKVINGEERTQSVVKSFMPIDNVQAVRDEVAASPTF